MTAEDMSDEKDDERSIEDVLSTIETKRAKMRQERDQEFLNTWNDLFCKEGSPGYMIRQAGFATLPVSWALMAFFKHKKF